MNHIKLTAFLVLALALVGMLFFFPRGSAQATPLLQMTPGIDPMSMPTVAAPTPQPGDALADPGAASGQMGCPMMSGAMTTSGTMSGMSQMGSQMGGMPMGAQMGSMTMGSQMGNMPMTGMQNVNDVLSNRTWGSWFFTMNPWWVLGWMVVFGLVLSLLVVGIILLARLLRKDRRAVTG